MSDEQVPRRSSFIAHRSALIRAASLLYLLHLLLIVKIALLELTAFWSIFCLGWALARREARFSFHILYYPLFVYGMISTVSAAFAEKRIHQGYEGMLWFKMLIFPCAVMLYREVPRLRQLATYAYAIVAGGGACWGLIEFAFLDRRDLEHRISGPSSHVMTYSGLLLPLSLMMLVLFWRQRKWWQLAACLLSSLTLLLTFTRSVWLGWAVAAGVVVLASRARLLVYAAPLLVLFVTFMPLDLFGRLISTFDMRQSSNFDRIRMLDAGVEIIRDHPVLGVGPANVKEAYAIYRKHDAPRPRPPHLHNNVIQLWAERGIIGLAAYVLLLALFLRECARAWRTPQRLWAEIGVVVAVSLAVAGLFEFNFGDTEVFYLMLDLFALIVVQMERPEPELNEAPVALVAPA
ncbi:MAG TPA: O-antigen ligase family protein [Thermoanaerobaculia bacterium]|jgi:O-antigen ligase|nr:O-antigen ligase family protein [Thermoanaerobaculia bacterium]